MQSQLRGIPKCFFGQLEFWRHGDPRPNNHTFARKEWLMGLAAFGGEAHQPHMFRRGLLASVPQASNKLLGPKSNFGIPLMSHMFLGFCSGGGRTGNRRFWAASRPNAAPGGEAGKGPGWGPRSMCTDFRHGHRSGHSWPQPPAALIGFPMISGCFHMVSYDARMVSYGVRVIRFAK